MQVYLYIKEEFSTDLVCCWHDKNSSAQN